jgi:hypothetical protein
MSIVTTGRTRHAGLPFRSVASGGQHGHGHDHVHGVIVPAVVRSREGVQAVAWSLGVLAVTAALQAVVFVLSRSVALFADLIHNGGDALTAIPLGIAFIRGRTSPHRTPHRAVHRHKVRRDHRNGWQNAFDNLAAALDS